MSKYVYPEMYFILKIQVACDLKNLNPTDTVKINSL